MLNLILCGPSPSGLVLAACMAMAAQDWIAGLAVPPCAVGLAQSAARSGHQAWGVSNLVTSVIIVQWERGMMKVVREVWEVREVREVPSP